MNDKDLRIAVLYRVKQHWRLPIFERMNNGCGLSIKVFHGSSFKGTKVVNSESSHDFPSKEMLTIPLKLKTSNGDALMPFSPFLFFHLLRYKPDVIICEGASNLANNIMAYIYASVFGVKKIQWGLGEIQNRKKSKLRRALDFIIEKIERSSDACISYSSHGKSYYESLGLTADKLFVAVNVVDTQRVIKKIKDMDSTAIYEQAHQNYDVNLLFVGALTKPKKVDLLLRSYCELKKNSSKRISLTIVGDGPVRESLETLASDLELKDVEFTGKIIEGVSERFLASDIFVLPGLGGLAVSEALAHGIPVVSGVGDGCEKDLLAHGAGIFDEKLDMASLIVHLSELINNEAKLSGMKDSAVHTIKNVHNIDTYIDSIFKCIAFVRK